MEDEKVKPWNSAKTDPHNPADRNPVPPFWRTSDIYLCGFLKLCGLNFERIEREGRRVFFTFKQSQLLQENVRNFYADTPVGALSYKGVIKNLKEVIYSELGQ